MDDVIASQQNQAEQPTIIELGEVAGQPLQTIDIGQVVMGVQRRSGAEANEIDAEYPDVAHGTQLSSDAAGFRRRALLTEDR